MGYFGGNVDIIMVLDKAVIIAMLEMDINK